MGEPQNTPQRRAAPAAPNSRSHANGNGGVPEEQSEMLRWRADQLLDEMMMGGVDVSAADVVERPQNHAGSELNDAEPGQNGFGHGHRHAPAENATPEDYQENRGHENGADRFDHAGTVNGNADSYSPTDSYGNHSNRDDFYFGKSNRTEQSGAESGLADGWGVRAWDEDWGHESNSAPVVDKPKRAGGDFSDSLQSAQPGVGEQQSPPDVDVFFDAYESSYSSRRPARPAPQADDTPGTDSAPARGSDARSGAGPREESHHPPQTGNDRFQPNPAWGTYGGDDGAGAAADPQIPSKINTTDYLSRRYGYVEDTPDAGGPAEARDLDAEFDAGIERALGDQSPTRRAGPNPGEQSRDYYERQRVDREERMRSAEHRPEPPLRNRSDEGKDREGRGEIDPLTDDEWSRPYVSREPRRDDDYTARTSGQSSSRQSSSQPGRYEPGRDSESRGGYASGSYTPSGYGSSGYSSDGYDSSRYGTGNRETGNHQPRNRGSSGKETDPRAGNGSAAPRRNERSEADDELFFDAGPHRARQLREELTIEPAATAKAEEPDTEWIHQAKEKWNWQDVSGVAKQVEPDPTGGEGSLYEFELAGYDRDPHVLREQGNGEAVGAMGTAKGKKRSTLLPRISSTSVDGLREKVDELTAQVNIMLPQGHEYYARAHHLLGKAVSILENDPMRSAEVEYYLQQVKGIVQRQEHANQLSSLYRERLQLYLGSWLAFSLVILVARYLFQWEFDAFLAGTFALDYSGFILQNAAAFTGSVFAGVLGSSVGALLTLWRHSRLPYGFVDRKYGLRGLILPIIGFLAGAVIYVPFGLFYSMIGLDPSLNVIAASIAAVCAFAFGFNQESIYGTRE